MKNSAFILFFVLMNVSASAQPWQILQRTSNDLVPLTTDEFKNDTLTLTSGKSYEIDLPELFDQNTGQLKKKLYVQNLSVASYLDLEIEHEINIIDLNDTTYVAKVMFQQVDQQVESETVYYARIIVRDTDGAVEKRLTIMPDTTSAKP